MADVLDYIAWRGDLTFDKARFREIDALCLCQISYLHFGGLLEKNDFSSSVKLSDLAEQFKKSKDFEKRAYVGQLINARSYEVLLKAGASERFKDIEVTGYVSILDTEKEEQFTAFTYKIQKNLYYVCYRGTDDTLVGWKEDFNLAIDDEVPAQYDAKKYLQTAAENLKGKFIVGGHSKGGNLAIYASAMSDDKLKKRIEKIYNFDGPGFTSRRIESQEFYQVIPKIRSYYPQLSVVGMLFRHAGEFRVIESDPAGVMSHDPFKWHVMGKGFVTLEDFDKETVLVYDTFNAWMEKLSPEQTEKFVDTLFNILESTGAKTYTELESNGFWNSIKIAAAIQKLDPELRSVMEEVLKVLFDAIRKNISLLKLRSKEED